MAEKEKGKGAKERRTFSPAPGRPAGGVGEFEFSPEVTPGTIATGRTAKDKNDTERAR